MAPLGALGGRVSVCPITPSEGSEAKGSSGGAGEGAAPSPGCCGSAGGPGGQWSHCSPWFGGTCSPPGMSPSPPCKLPAPAWLLPQGLIFVVDSNDRERVQESADELQKMVSDGRDSVWRGGGCPPALLLLVRLCSSAGGVQHGTWLCSAHHAVPGASLRRWAWGPDGDSCARQRLDLRGSGTTARGKMAKKMRF